MRFELNIDYPLEKMEMSRKRMEARGKFKMIDRVPVNYCVVPRYFSVEFGLRYLDYFKDVETQYYWQLQFAKFQIENIPCDFCSAPVINVFPYFDNAIPPSAQGAEVGYAEETPLRALPTIHTVEEMERFEVAKPTAGLRGTAIEWWQKMKELAQETRVTFNGQEGRVDVSTLSLNGLSPHMLAIDLVGENFFWWMLEYPEACHRFLQKITQGEIDSENYNRQIDPRPRGDVYGLAEDSATMMSAKLFREFCVPYASQIFDLFGTGGRHIHNCGNSIHLLKSLKEDMKMTGYDIFGYLVPPKVAAQYLGGSTLMWGNINPMLMLDGTKAEVKQAAMECLEALAPCGGFMLGDGANVCPRTPLESFHAIMEASQEYGTGKE